VSRVLGRRTVLSAFGAAVLSSCGTAKDRPATGPSSATASSARPPSPEATLPGVAAYELPPGEVEPACKTAAVKAISAALTWPSAPLDDRLRQAGALPSLAEGLTGLVADHFASTVEILYPQYGGLGDSRQDASVILVARQHWLPARGAEPLARDFTVDVRLRRISQRWAAETAILPDLPAPAATDDAKVRALLSNQAVLLPSAARADLTGGIVHPPVIDALDALSRRWRVHVQVLRSGHPRNVYGTPRTSNHTRGRAVDVWAVDGVPVISQPRAVWSAVMSEAARAGADELGGPGVIDGAPSYTNDVHRDHIHIGFRVQSR
jgi:hypothetical protein